MLLRILKELLFRGGQFSVYDDNSPQYDPRILNSGKPVFGICYGHQSIAHISGGNVTSTENREYGEKQVIIQNESPLFDGISEREFRVWMSHGDIVKEAPAGFDVLALSGEGQIAAMQNRNKNIYSVQFHPEVDHTDNGRKILDNFLNICNASRTWDPGKDYERIVEETEEIIRGKVGVGGISGGVDSSTVSVLVGKIAGDDYHPIFVDNGLLRLGEVGEVMDSLAPFGLNVKCIDASERFLAKLVGVVDSKEKRKIIGREFIEVFDERAKEIGDVSYLVQGTLYPDVIESVPVYGASSEIKPHHNVGGLPERMDLEVVEPFRNLFKDEVRKIALERLGMPRNIVWRHPSPGPGLAIRIIGSDVTPEKLDILRKADDIYIKQLRQRDLYYDMNQAFAGLLDTNAVGVMGDKGTYDGTIVLRAVVTDDFMTADWYDFTKKDLTGISNAIVNGVKGIGRVFYDTTQKPPGTIEWE